MCPETSLELLLGMVSNCLKTSLKQLVFLFLGMVGVQRRHSTKIAPTFIHKYVSNVMLTEILEVGGIVRLVLVEFGRVAHDHGSLRNRIRTP